MDTRTRALVGVALVAAMACSCASPPAEQSAMNSGVCDAAKVQWAIGMPGDQATMGRIWRESGAGLFRPLIKGQTPQKGYKADRVNIHLDGDNRIVAIDCG